MKKDEISHKGSDPVKHTRNSIRGKRGHNKLVRKKVKECLHIQKDQV